MAFQSDDSDVLCPSSLDEREDRDSHPHAFESEASSEHDDKFVEGEGRLVWFGLVATQSFRIPLNQCSRLPHLLDRVREVAPALDIDRIKEDQPLSPRKVILLQETSDLRQHRQRWTTIDSDGNLEYVHWYIRNVLQGNATKLRFEIHVRWLQDTEDEDVELGSDDTENCLRSAGTGQEIADYLKKPYSMIWTRVHSNRVLIPFSAKEMAKLENIHRGHIDQTLNDRVLGQWPATCAWFPKRIKENSQKRKKPSKDAEHKDVKQEQEIHDTDKEEDESEDDSDEEQVQSEESDKEEIESENNENSDIRDRASGRNARRSQGRYFSDDDAFAADDEATIKTRHPKRKRDDDDDDEE